MGKMEAVGAAIREHEKAQEHADIKEKIELCHNEVNSLGECAGKSPKEIRKDDFCAPKLTACLVKNQISSHNMGKMEAVGAAIREHEENEGFTDYAPY